VPVASSRMVWRVLRCPSKRGISSLCCSCAFSACWVGEVSAQYLISIRCLLFCCMSLSLVARGMDWQGIRYGYHRQPLLHYWQTQFGTCLLGFFWGVAAGSE
jgi:hypothetical protein